MFKRLKRWFDRLDTGPDSPRKVRVGAETVPLSSVNFNPNNTTPSPRHSPRMASGSSSSLGQQREHNEDSLYTLHGFITSQDGQKEIGLFLMADGMGGYDRGEIASRVAVDVFADRMVEAFFRPGKSDGIKEGTVSLQALMEGAMQQANRAVLAATPGGGTTLTAVLVIDKEMHIAHIGDTRAYLVEDDGVATQLTNDHSLVQRLIEMGQISRVEAFNHPQRNVLYRALGQHEPLKIDFMTLPVKAGSTLLLATDGLWGSVAEGEMLAVAHSHAPALQICNDLCLLADEAGGADNCSVILIKFLPMQAPPSKGNADE